MRASRTCCAQVRHLKPGTHASVSRARCLSVAFSHSSSAGHDPPPNPPAADVSIAQHPHVESPFIFQTGYATFAKRQSRPLPPPFYTPPTSSFTEPLSRQSTRHAAKVNGEVIRGLTNGDDALLAGDNFVGVNDGVGAWTARPRGHAALWSRLILHFWALETARSLKTQAEPPDPVKYLQSAYEQTIAATADPEWLGTTTATAAILYHQRSNSEARPVLYVTNLGDSQILVIRPRRGEVIYRTTEQWHWFDCPRQLGTNSPDTPMNNAVCDKIDVEVDDIVLAMSDGVPDNLWEHEILENVMECVSDSDKHGRPRDGLMTAIARKVMNAARVIAQDPFAESPFMERAVDEGLAMEGGKLDDISVVAAHCQRRPGN